MPFDYGLLLGHWAVRSLMFQAAQVAGVAPWRLSFTGTLSVIRRAIPKFQNLQAEDLPFFFTWLIREILDEQIPERAHRSNPRVVKKPISKFPSKKPMQRGTRVKRSALTFCILSTA